MKDRIVLITGSGAGIGLQTARDLAKMGARVIIHSRTTVLGESVLGTLRREIPEAKFDLFVADFEIQKQIHQMAAAISAAYKKIDVLINNAAIFMEERKLTADTIEKTFAVNHLAPFLLTHLLLPLLQKSDEPRIINVSSHAHYTAQFNIHNLQGEQSYNGVQVYNLSKLCNLLFTYSLAERLRDERIVVHALHPGFADTRLYHQLLGPFEGGSLPDSVNTILHLASDDGVKCTTGLYFMNRHPVESSAHSYKKRYQLLLWRLSEQLTVIQNYTPAIANKKQYPLLVWVKGFARLIKNRVQNLWRK